MKSPLESIFESDPLGLKHYKTKHTRTIYSMCALVPTLIAFSLVFYLMFYMSPHGRNMRQYQSEIYDWNKENMAEAFSKFKFSFTFESE